MFVQFAMITKASVIPSFVMSSLYSIELMIRNDWKWLQIIISTNIMYENSYHYYLFTGLCAAFIISDDWREYVHSLYHSTWWYTLFFINSFRMSWLAALQCVCGIWSILFGSIKETNFKLDIVNLLREKESARATTATHIENDFLLDNRIDSYRRNE